MGHMKRFPKVIAPRSRVRLIRADKKTPSWRENVGRQFRIGYYSRQDGLDCIWLVNENGKYEQTTDRDFLLKYFQIECLSKERNVYGRGKPRLGRIRTLTPIERLNGRSTMDVYEAAKLISTKDDADTLRSVINTLRRGKRPMNRAAAAYALNLMRGKGAVPALEKSVGNKKENPKVRGQAAESLAGNHRSKSHHILLQNLEDPSKDVRFWCAYSLSELRDIDALIPLRKLFKSDHRTVKGFWSVSREAKASIRKIQEQMRVKRGRHKHCIFCSGRPKKYV